MWNFPFYIETHNTFIFVKYASVMSLFPFTLANVDRLTYFKDRCGDVVAAENDGRD